MNRNVIPAIFIIAIIIMSAAFKAEAQYYYKDVLANQQLNKEFSILKNKKIKIVKLKSFEDDDQPSDGFFCEKKINKNYTQSEMLSKSNITGQSLLITDYDAMGRVVTTTNNTPTTSNVVKYKYDDQSRMASVTSLTKADGDSSGIEEVHDYSYDSNNRPMKMVRLKNKKVIATILFIQDEKGNIIEEKVEGKSNDRNFYYYYDEKDRLTDVVRFNHRAQKLLPDYMLEYGDNNLPKQIISVDEDASNYFIWRYAYTTSNLPEIQKCYSKEKRLLGTIEYEYK